MDSQFPLSVRRAILQALDRKPTRRLSRSAAEHRCHVPHLLPEPRPARTAGRGRTHAERLQRLRGARLPGRNGALVLATRGSRLRRPGPKLPARRASLGSAHRRVPAAGGRTRRGADAAALQPLLRTIEYAHPDAPHEAASGARSAGPGGTPGGRTCPGISPRPAEIPGSQVS